MMKRINVCSILIVMLIVTPSILFSQTANTFLNPGIRLGYTFGQSDSFTWGLELSLTSGEWVQYGAVLDVDFCKERSKIHLGVEASFIAGLCVGPTLISEDGEKDIGVSFISFIGLWVIPYYEYTYRTNRPSLNEFGAYFKGNIPINGKYPHSGAD